MAATLVPAFDTQRWDEMDLAQARASVAASMPLSLLTALLPSSDLLPVPSTKCNEVPIRSALRTRGHDALVAATLIEINKQQGFGAIGTVDLRRLQLPICVRVDARMFYKLKDDDRFMCRIAAMGDRLPPLLVVGDLSKTLSLAAVQAHCAHRHENLLISDADVI